MNVHKRWIEENDQLYTTIETDNFTSAVRLVQQIAKLAEEHRHHPDIKIHNYNKVSIWLTSHDVKQITERDRKLAAAIDRLL